MSGSEGKMDILFEVLCFDWSGSTMQEDFEKGGISFHVENVNVLEYFTPVAPASVDAVIYCGSSKKMKRPEMTKYIDLYSNSPLRIWMQKSCDDFHVDTILKERFQVTTRAEKCRKLCKWFFSQLCTFLTKLLAKLDLNDSKTVEYEDLAVYAEQFGIELTPQDVEMFLSENQDEGDAFLTLRGVLKWIKKGKPASPVGTIILKVIEAKRLLNGFTADVKRVFLGQPDKPQNLEGDLEFTVGDSDFAAAQVRAELHFWSRSRFPEPHPQEVLQLTPVESSMTVSFTLARKPGHTFTQIQDFMRNTVFRLEQLLSSALRHGESESVFTVDYRITEDAAILYLIPDLGFVKANDRSFDREFKGLFTCLQSSVSCDGHFVYEAKSGLKDCMEQGENDLHGMLGQGLRFTGSYSIDSALRDVFLSFPFLAKYSFLLLLLKKLHGKTHFSTFSELPEALQKPLKSSIPKKFSTMNHVLMLIGSLMNQTIKDYLIEKQVEMMIRTVTDLFDVERLEATMSVWNLVIRWKLQLSGLEDLLKIDLSEVRRQADEAKRAAAAGDSEKEGSGENSMVEEVAKRKSSSLIKSGSGTPEHVLLSGSGSQNSILSGPKVEVRGRRKASSSSSGNSTPRKASIGPGSRSGSESPDSAVLLQEPAHLRLQPLEQPDIDIGIKIGVLLPRSGSSSGSEVGMKKEEIGDVPSPGILKGSVGSRDSD